MYVIGDRVYWNHDNKLDRATIVQVMPKEGNYRVRIDDYHYDYPWDYDSPHCHRAKPDQLSLIGEPRVCGLPTCKPAVNDYICPTCKNNRVSKTENLCWRCGNKLFL